MPFTIILTFIPSLYLQNRTNLVGNQLKTNLSGKGKEAESSERDNLILCETNFGNSST